VKESWKREPVSKGVSETAVSELGRAVQYKKDEFYEGKGLKGASPRPAAAGPGGGRTIYGRGTQGRH